MSDLVVEAAGHARRLQPRRVLSAVPAHHIYGLLFTILLPLQAGCEVVDIRRTLPGDDAFRPGDVIISFPQHWQFLLRSMQTLPAVCGVSSTATLPADLAAALRDGGLVRLVEIYGSSETSGIAWRDATEGAFALLDGLRVVAAPEGPGVLRLARADGRELVTPDLVEMAGPAAFYVRGRADGAVQVGGLNVYPAQVAQMLEQHPLVARARVRLAADAAGGRLKALVVPKPECGSTETLRADLERWILARLPPAERPRSVTFAGTLPVGALGKECDWMETP
jgi:4-coumarate--CoA ligase (photoactive yellow protein activation family)